VTATRGPSAVAALVSMTSSTAMAQTAQTTPTIETTTLLNCGVTKENSRSVYGTMSGGHMAAYSNDCSNERPFDCKKTQAIALTINGAKVGTRVGSKHYGCHGDSAAKDSSKVIWNKSSNYILVHRPNKDKTYAVAIPKDLNLSCALITKNATQWNRFRLIE